MYKDEITISLDENVKIITLEDIDVTLADTMGSGDIPENHPAIKDGIVTPISC